MLLLLLLFFLMLLLLFGCLTQEIKVIFEHFFVVVFIPLTGEPCHANLNEPSVSRSIRVSVLRPELESLSIVLIEVVE